MSIFQGSVRHPAVIETAGSSGIRHCRNTSGSIHVFDSMVAETNTCLKPTVSTVSTNQIAMIYLMPSPIRQAGSHLHLHFTPPDHAKPRCWILLPRISRMRSRSKSSISASSESPSEGSELNSIQSGKCGVPTKVCWF